MLSKGVALCALAFSLLEASTIAFKFALFLLTTCFFSARLKLKYSGLF